MGHLEENDNMSHSLDSADAGILVDNPANRKPMHGAILLEKAGCPEEVK